MKATRAGKEKISSAAQTIAPQCSIQHTKSKHQRELTNIHISKMFVLVLSSYETCHTSTGTDEFILWLSEAIMMPFLIFYSTCHWQISFKNRDFHKLFLDYKHYLARILKMEICINETQNSHPLHHLPRYAIFLCVILFLP
jgi:uncharacterized membrane protein YhdT